MNFEKTKKKGNRIMKNDKSELRKGHRVCFHSGNFKGKKGTVVKKKYNVPNTPYGLLFTVELDDGGTCFIEKAEHWQFI